MEFVIPSFNRPKCLTAKYFKNYVKICVPESQREAYEKENDCEIITHSDLLKGLANKRQWIYEKYKDVFMFDDDLKGFKQRFNHKIAGKVDANEIIDACYEMEFICKNIGAHVFGFTSEKSPITYNGFNLFKLNGGYINGCNLGLIWDQNLKFPSSDICTAVEDFYISFMSISKHGYILQDTRYTPMQEKTFINRGGQASFRNTETENKDNLLLLNTFGSKFLKNNTAIQSRLNKKIK